MCTLYWRLSIDVCTRKQLALNFENFYNASHVYNYFVYCLLRLYRKRLNKIEIFYLTVQVRSDRFEGHSYQNMNKNECK